MRTTLDIDDGVLAAARALARDTDISIGAAISDLARRGLSATTTLRVQDGFPTFANDPDSAPITLDLVNAHRDG